MDLNDTLAFCAVGRAGSFTRAAERLGVPKGTVSRQVARLETRLGARLFHRTTRRVTLTEVGRAYFERCAHAVDTLADAERRVADAAGRVAGTLRVATSFDFARDWLSGWLPELHRRHPELRLELELSQRRVDLVEENVDVAIRGGGPMNDSGHVAKKLLPSELRFYASPSYLRKHGTPRTLSDLAAHQCMTLLQRSGSTRWRLEGPTGPVDVDLAGWFSVNELGVLRAAIRAGLGVGLCESQSMRADVEARRVKNVLADHRLGSGALWAVYPSRHHLSPNVRAFVDFITAKLKAEAP